MYNKLKIRLSSVCVFYFEQIREIKDKQENSDKSKIEKIKTFAKKCNKRSPEKDAEEEARAYKATRKIAAIQRNLINRQMQVKIKEEIIF